MVSEDRRARLIEAIVALEIRSKELERSIEEFERAYAGDRHMYSFLMWLGLIVGALLCAHLVWLVTR